MSKSIIACVDMTEPGKGIAMLTGGHGYPASPQAVLRQDGTGWGIDDSYGDLDRNGGTARPDFFSVAGTRRSAIRKWLRHLRLNPDDVEIRVNQYYGGDETAVGYLTGVLQYVMGGGRLSDPDATVSYALLLHARELGAEDGSPDLTSAAAAALRDAVDQARQRHNSLEVDEVFRDFEEQARKLGSAK